MKILAISDLHLEFGCSLDIIPDDNFDVVVLAGDIARGTDGVDWALNYFKNVPILYVPGNQEYFVSDFNDVRNNLLKRNDHRIKVMDNDYTFINGVKFIGSTLWSDFKVYNDNLDAVYKNMALTKINDFSIIENGDRKFHPDDCVNLFNISKSYIETELKTDSKTVVITHFLPSLKSNDPQYLGDKLSSYFASDLEKMILDNNPALWIHGHSHYNVDYMLGNTRIFSQQFGYGESWNKYKMNAKVIEI